MAVIQENLIVVDTLFDTKYKKIIRLPFDPVVYCKLLEWLQDSTIGLVTIQLHNASEKNGKWILDDDADYQMFIGFESTDDYLYFKIRFTND